MAGLEMRYFILKPKGDNVYAEASRQAMLAYAEYISHVNPDFACELASWAEDEQTAVDNEYRLQKGLEL